MFRKSLDMGGEFTKICGSDSATKMTIEHLSTLADALKIQTDDIVMYILPWKLNAKVPLEISKEEWVEGMRTMRIETMDRLQQALPNMRKDIQQSSNSFKQFYNFVFDWVRESTSAKFLPNDSACDLWELLLQGRPFPKKDKWIEFVKTVHRKPISRDLWRQTLDFAPLTADLSNYDAAGAWPTAMDEFVEWLKKPRTAAA